jgi:hypothetical protein
MGATLTRDKGRVIQIRNAKARQYCRAFAVLDCYDRPLKGLRSYGVNRYQSASEVACSRIMNVVSHTSQTKLNAN